MKRQTIFLLTFALVTVQNAFSFSKSPHKKINTTSGKTTADDSGQINYFSRLEYTDDKTNSADISRKKENISAENESFIPKSIVRTLNIQRKRNFLEINEKKDKIEYKQTEEKHLQQFPNGTHREKRSVPNPKKRILSSHVSIQTINATVRVDLSANPTEQQQNVRSSDCRFITRDNRRLIENLADAINCGTYPQVDNGHFELFLGDLDENIEPRINCDRYYVRQGPINGGLICVDGKWFFDASCEKVRCPEELEVPINGQNISMTGNQFNDTATFSCLNGYELIGEEIIACGEDGEWTGDVPSCKLVQCPNITAPEHGFVSDNLEFDSNQTLLIEPDFNTTVTYWCEEGYTLIGRSEIKCQADGTWSHRRRPECKKVCLVPFTKRLSSTVWLQPHMNTLNVKTEFQFGQQIIYLCRKRYKSDNDGGAMCVNGKWVPPIKCRRNYACNEPLPPKNGRISDRINRSLVQFTCDYGYQITGGNTQTCLRNGTWSGTKPKCRKMCRMPQVFALKDAWLSLQFTKFQRGDQLLVGSTIEYSCKNGYRKAVDAPSTCNDGDWIPEPRCISTIVRLTGSQRGYAGLVEVYINGKWGLVCDHLFVNFGSWGLDESKVVCKMLGYAFGNKAEAASFKRITKHITYQSVSCSGEERSILECNTMKAKVWCDRFIAVRCYSKIMEI